MKKNIIITIFTFLFILTPFFGHAQVHPVDYNRDYIPQQSIDIIGSIEILVFFAIVVFLAMKMTKSNYLLKDNKKINHIFHLVILVELVLAIIGLFRKSSYGCGGYLYDFIHPFGKYLDCGPGPVPMIIVGQLSQLFYLISDILGVTIILYLAYLLFDNFCRKQHE